MVASYTDSEQKILLAVARAAISHGVAHQKPMRMNPEDYPQSLQQSRAAFVTLHLEKQLRGCMGTLTARASLVEEVAAGAYNAAMRDPRFPPVAAHEIARLQIHLAVLTEATPIDFVDEDDLLNQLVPGVDGLILEAGRHRGTFLPAVWETLTEPRDFLNQLKRKAGLAPDAWPKDIRVSRYYTQDIE